jgi:thioredoxin reductase (NADPH)
MRETDIVIIGAGPIGIELAVAIKKAGMDYLHLEAGQVGATMQWWAPGTKYFSSPERIEIAGVPLIVHSEEKATRENYLEYLRAVVGTHQLDIETYTRVMQIEKNDSGFTLRTARSFHGVGGEAELDFNPDTLDELEPIHAKRIVLAIGDMHLPRMLGIPGEDLPHVSHYLGDVHQYANQPVTIVGGKNSAVEAAIRLFRAGAKVTMVHRGAWFDPDRIKYWLYPEIEYLIKKDKIRYIPHANLTSITPTHATLDTGESIESRFVLLLTGYVQRPDLFEQLGVELVGDDRKPRHDLKTMETNVAGVYVAGTGSAGTQSRTKVFIETSHVHVDRILASLQGGVSDVIAEDYTLEES